jgi:Leucine-rich repeat (LRR) protein
MFFLFYDYFTEILGLDDNQLEEDLSLILNVLPRRLTSLELESNLLTGTIPPSIGTFTNLEFLDVHGNNLRGRIPAELGLLTKLAYLDLSSSQLTGTVPTSLASLPLLSKSTQLLFFLYHFEILSLK